MVKCKYCGRTYTSDKTTLCEGCGAAISVEDRITQPPVPKKYPKRRNWPLLPVLWEIFCGVVLFILLVSRAWPGAVVFVWLAAASYLLVDSRLNRERYRQMASPFRMNAVLLCWVLFCAMMELVFLSMGYLENTGIFTLIGLLSLAPWLWKLSRRYLWAS